MCSAEGLAVQTWLDTEKQHSVKKRNSKTEESSLRGCITLVVTEKTASRLPGSITGSLAHWTVLQKTHCGRRAA